MAFYEEEGRVVTRSALLCLCHNTMTSNKAELHLKPDSPLLFRVTTWISRQVFKIDNAQAFPLLHHASMEALDFRAGTAASLDTIAPSPTEKRILLKECVILDPIKMRNPMRLGGVEGLLNVDGLFARGGFLDRPNVHTVENIDDGRLHMIKVSGVRGIVVTTINLRTF